MPSALRCASVSSARLATSCSYTCCMSLTNNATGPRCSRVSSALSHKCLAYAIGPMHSASRSESSASCTNSTSSSRKDCSDEISSPSPVVNAWSSLLRSSSRRARCRPSASSLSRSEAPNAEISVSVGCHIAGEPKYSAACFMHCKASRLPWSGSFACATSSSGDNRRKRKPLSVTCCIAPRVSGSSKMSSSTASYAATASSSSSSAARMRFTGCVPCIVSSVPVAFWYALTFSTARFFASTASVKLKRYSVCCRACHSATCNCSSCQSLIPRGCSAELPSLNKCRMSLTTRSG